MATKQATPDPLPLTVRQVQLAPGDKPSTVEVRADDGQGSTITVRVPIDQAPAVGSTIQLAWTP